MTKPLPMKVGDGAYCNVCEESITISKVDPNRYGPGKHGYTHYREYARGNFAYSPRCHFRKLPDREVGD